MRDGFNQTRRLFKPIAQPGLKKRQITSDFH
jgi:hypothetical protein